MDFLTQVIASFTPQVIFGMIGGFIGGLFGIDKQAYGVKISVILLIIAIISESLVLIVMSLHLTVLPTACMAILPHS